MTDIIRLPPWTTNIEFAREAWVSANAKEVWEPRVKAISKALGVLELESVYHRYRPSAMLFKTPEELVELNLDAAKHGCSVVTLQQQGVEGDTGIYSNRSKSYEAGKPFKYRVAVTRTPKPWERAYKDSDQVAIGRLLGFPECCSKFFQRVYVDEKWADTTLMMSENGSAGPVEGNILLRWLNVRLVRHLPCSFDCEGSAQVGRDTVELGRKLGFNDEMDWALEMLSWPMEYSSKNGIALIVTPVLKISTTSDPLGTKFVLRREGTGEYPEEGAVGLHFPFQAVTKRKITESKSHRRGVEVDSWTDNGFQSKAGMIEAHDALLRVASRAENLLGICDLGCGNGVLLERLKIVFPDASLYGVEILPDRWRAAEARVASGITRLGSIADLSLWNVGGTRNMVILMPGRLTEMTSEEAAGVVEQLKRSQYVLLYAYDDMVGKADVRRLAGQGFRDIASHYDKRVAAVLWCRE